MNFFVTSNNSRDALISVTTPCIGCRFPLVINGNPPRRPDSEGNLFILQIRLAAACAKLTGLSAEYIYMRRRQKDTTSR